MISLINNNKILYKNYKNKFKLYNYNHKIIFLRFKINNNNQILTSYKIK